MNLHSVVALLLQVLIGRSSRTLFQCGGCVKEAQQLCSCALQEVDPCTEKRAMECPPAAISWRPIGANALLRRTPRVLCRRDAATKIIWNVDASASLHIVLLSAVLDDHAIIDEEVQQTSTKPSLGRTFPACASNTCSYAE